MTWVLKSHRYKAGSFDSTKLHRLLLYFSDITVIEIQEAFSVLVVGVFSYSDLFIAIPGNILLYHNNYCHSDSGI